MNKKTASKITLPNYSCYAVTRGTYNTGDYRLFKRKTKKGFINLLLSLNYKGSEPYNGETFNNHGTQWTIRFYEFDFFIG